VQFRGAMTRLSADYSIARTKTRAKNASGNGPLQVFEITLSFFGYRRVPKWL
jgi:hypothetical protein